MENLLHDIRFGFRTLIKNPGFSAVAIIALALGTGVNSAIFSVVDAILLRPLPYRNPDRLVLVWTSNPTTPRDAMSVPDFFEYRDQNQVFEELGAFSYDDFNITSGDEPEHIAGTMVSANYFDTLGVNFTRGRGFLPGEDQALAERVAIIGDGLWKRRFASDPNIVNQTIQLNGAPFTVVGVAPPSFQSPNPEDKPEIWVPIAFDGGDRFRVPSVTSPETIKDRRNRFLIGIGRLKPSASPKQAQAEMDTIAGRLREQYKDTNASLGIGVVPLREHFVGKIETALTLLLGAVGFVLLIACANVANLLLARSVARKKEIAIRAALGAGRFRLIRQLLTESVLLAMIGSALGLALAYGEIKILIALNPANIPRLSEIHIDSRVLAFTFVIAIVTGLVFGLAPALDSSRTDLNETLKEGARGSTGGIAGRRVRNLLVVSEVALTVMLLIGAALMMRSLYSLQKVKPGFNPENVLTMMVNVPAYKYSKDDQIRTFYQQALDRIQSLPGVQSAAAITSLPLTTAVIIRLRFSIDGRPPASPNEALRANFRGISSDYFRTMSIPLSKGRYFTEQDHDKAPAVLIVNESFANRFWPNEDPIGKHLTIPFIGGSREVVGVVSDVKHSSLDTESGLEMYVPYTQKPFNFMGLVVRTTGDPIRMAPAVRGEILSIDRSQPVYDVKSMSQIVGESVSQPRLYTLLLAIFATLAVVLAAVGIYGVMSYSVTQRSHEIGIRMALGADRSDILKMVVGNGMLLAAVGMALGLGAAFVSARVLESLLFGVGIRDLTTFISVPLLLAAITFLSCFIPARRATHIDPMVALRYE